MPAQKTTEQHRAEVEQIGKVVLVGEYKGARTKTTYYCPTHDFTEEALPTNVLKGRGLLCCKQQGSQDAADRKKAKAAAKYDSELAEHSKLQRIEAYVDSKTPIKHRCLIHNEEHPVAPSDGRIGKGARCCLEAGWANENLRFTHEQFIARLAERNPDIEWISGEYINNQSKLTCRCKKHDHTQPNVWAMQVLAGHGLKCCGIENSREVGRNSLNGSTVDNVWRSLTNRLSTKGNAYLYLFESPISGLNKYGIGRDPGKRKRDGGYGKQLIEHRFFPDRRDAVLIEQAFKYGFGVAEPAELADWVGREELTNLQPEEFLEVIEHLEEALSRMGRWEFAEEYCDPRELERAHNEATTER